MNDLLKEQCVACRRDSPRVTAAEIEELAPSIPEWKIVECEGVPQLERVFRFKDFSQALEFTNRVGELSNRQDHHPKLCTEWGKVTATWWTHLIKGLHRNDFIMAAKSDQIFSEMTGAPSESESLSAAPRDKKAV